MKRRTFLAVGAASLAAPAIAQTDPLAAAQRRAEGMEQLHSLQVARNGETMLEIAPRGPGLDALANIKSVSKTIVATLLGCAIDRGAIADVGATLGEVAPRLIPAGAAPQVSGISMEDLVTLRAGLERTSGANYGPWIASGNWVANALARPMVAEPGGRMLYSTGSTHILGAALSVATGDSLLTLARRWIGQPLGIDIPPWTQDPQGYYLGGNQMALTPRAMLRFGEMIRQRGTFDGARVISADWIERSFMPVTRSAWSGMGYGYGWFLGRASGTQYALARGYGGQIIAVAPALGLTVVITSDPTRPARSGGYFSDLRSLIERDVLAPLA